MRRGVFIDRDGTLNAEVNYLHRAQDFRWIRGAPRAIKLFNLLGLVTVVVTNQSGVARGYFSEADVLALHRHISADLKKWNARIDQFYAAYAHPDGIISQYKHFSRDRKPGLGLFERASTELSVDLGRSFLIGDNETDIIPGNQLGMTTFLVRTGHGHAFENETSADFVVDSIVEAARIIRVKCQKSLQC